MKIELTQIDGYRPDMTAEEKLALLEGIEIPEPSDADAKKWKAQFDKASSELAAANKALKAKMSEDERKEAEQAAKEAERESELATLRREKTVSENKARLIGLGYDEKSAEEAAQAWADGDMAKFADHQKVHLEKIRRAASASSLAGDPRPPAGHGPTQTGKEQLIQQYEAARKAGNHPLAFTLQDKIKNYKQE